MEQMRDTFGKVLAEMAVKDERIVVLDADVAPSTKTSYAQKAIPERFFEVGNAEQAMIGIAAGLAIMGKIPFASTFCVFISKRACDQVSISIAYQDLPVKLCGVYSGIISGNNGSTHQAVEDIAIMRAIPNMTVIEPADGIEMKKVMEAVLDYPHPVYLRINRDEVHDFYPEDKPFKIGKSQVIRPGKDVSIIASGIMTWEALEAAKTLAAEGIEARVINLSSIKPIDVETIVAAAQETGAIVTAENHNIYGGVGGAVAEVLVENSPVPMLRVGLKDTWGGCGLNDEIMSACGMTAEDIVGAVKAVLKKKRG
jgi:transketolase